MKNSHYQTPRTLNECHFTPGYISGPVASTNQGIGWLAVALTLCAGFIGLALSWALG